MCMLICAARKTSRHQMLKHTLIDRLIDWVKVLRPTQHKIGHSGTFFPANLLAQYWTEKTNWTQQKQTCIRNNKNTVMQNKHKN